MIVIDTSALVAILDEEPQGQACLQVLENNEDFCISAGTLAEAYIVLSYRNLGAALAELIVRFQIEVVPVTAATSALCGAAHIRWGRTMHKAGLNFGDCFAYTLAEQRKSPLLFIGNDFVQTDIISAI